MEYKYLLDIGLIILVVKVFTMLTQKIKMPKVLGGLIAGIVLGPAMLNIVQNSTILEALSKFGIILIMFLAGMETSIKKFIADSNKYVIIAAVGVVVPLILGAIFSLIYVQDFKTNLFFGAVITATSVSITVETLIEMKKIKSSVGLAILGAGVVDDIMGILFLTIIMNSGNLHITTFAIMLLKIIIFFGMALILGLSLFKVFEKIEKKDVKTEFEIIILGCSSTDFDDEYPATEQVRLINGDWVNKEYLKCNAFDFISILIRNAKGRIYKVLEMELSYLNRL